MRKTIILIFACLSIVSCSAHNQITKKPPNNSIKLQKPTVKVLNGALKTDTDAGGLKKQSNVVSSKQPSTSVSDVPVVVPPYSKNISAVSAKPTTNIKRSNGKIKISVENMPLNEFVNLIFSKTLNVGYFVDNGIKKKRDLITLKMENPVDENKLLEITKDILSRYSIVVKKKGDTYFVVPGKTAHLKPVINEFIVGRYVPQSVSDNSLVMAIIPFYYVSPSRWYISIIKRLALSKDAQVWITPSRESIMIIDRALNIRSALNVISIFDRLTFRNKKAVLVNLNYLSPKEFIDRLKVLLPTEGIPIATNISRPGVMLVPMPEVNSVFVVSPKQKWVDIVLYWKQKLDDISALGDRPRFFVFYPKNRKAGDLSKVFSQVGNSLHTVFAPKKGSSKKTSTVSSVSSENNGIKVILDSERNALVILSTPSEYQEIKEVLEKLDTLPKEVLVQVTIAEITLTNNLQYGIEWYLKHNGKYSGILQTVGGLSLGAGGINYSVISNTAKFQALINAYAHKNLINVISSPRLVVLDNRKATINIGTEVPTVTNESNSSDVQDSGTTALVRTIEYRNTGVILSIKPTINSYGILTLDIDQQVSEPQVNNTSKIDSPLILNRAINTSVVLRSGSTLLLGGLIKNNKSSTTNKVPILGNIPIIGNLFKTTSKGSVRTELIVEITPYIISNIAEVKQKTKEYESLMKWFKSDQSLVN